ncbi:unnamed protein product [Prunus armeniaca]
MGKLATSGPCSWGLHVAAWFDASWAPQQFCLDWKAGSNSAQDFSLPKIPHLSIHALEMKWGQILRFFWV